MSKCFNSDRSVGKSKVDLGWAGSYRRSRGPSWDLVGKRRVHFSLRIG